MTPRLFGLASHFLSPPFSHSRSLSLRRCAAPSSEKAARAAPLCRRVLRKPPCCRTGSLDAPLTPSETAQSGQGKDGDTRDLPLDWSPLLKPGPSPFLSFSISAVEAPLRPERRRARARGGARRCSGPFGPPRGDRMMTRPEEEPAVARREAKPGANPLFPVATRKLETSRFNTLRHLDGAPFDNSEHDIEKVTVRNWPPALAQRSAVTKPPSAVGRARPSIPTAQVECQIEEDESSTLRFRIRLVASLLQSRLRLGHLEAVS
ncbi:hypothetical protein SKAU_G00266910 [Synaphobranchus kaupii]|uniref:Uncharacterized protein n=1 Tax=Synaphobranchus kaupii TaxID=118154 RepID=A0A9Q1EZI0_SYNKA|nr:hypothetical protein SKAU_G00266910 [Synaphobranchus kaupii]